MGLGGEGGVWELIVVDMENDIAVEVADVVSGAVLAVEDRYLEGITVLSKSLS